MVSGLGNDGETMEMAHGSDDGDEAKYGDGNGDEEMERDGGGIHGL